MMNELLLIYLKFDYDMKKEFYFCIVLAIVSLCFCACDTSEQDFEKAKKDGTVKAYDTFIANHLKSDFVEEARDSIVAIYDRVEDLHVIAKEIYGIVDYDAASKVRKKLVRRSESLYYRAYVENSIDGWTEFIESVPELYQKDAQERKLELQWENESLAWKMASINDNALSYEKYLDHHPKGKHAKQAEKKLIDLEVAAVFAGEHGILPAMDKGYSTGSSRSTIEIENRTQYDLTVSYSGPDSKRMVIPAHGTRKMTIGNGYYRVAASVGHGVMPFAGTEQLDGSHFSSSFYISTIRSRY